MVLLRGVEVSYPMDGRWDRSMQPEPGSLRTGCCDRLPTSRTGPACLVWTRSQPLEDRIDNDWGYAILARDEFFVFRAIDMGSSHSSRVEAVRRIQDRIAELARAPQRIWPQSQIGPSAETGKEL